MHGVSAIVAENGSVVIAPDGHVTDYATVPAGAQAGRNGQSVVSVQDRVLCSVKGSAFAVDGGMSGYGVGCIRCSGPGSRGDAAPNSSAVALGDTERFGASDVVARSPMNCGGGIMAGSVICGFYCGDRNASSTVDVDWLCGCDDCSRAGAVSVSEGCAAAVGNAIEDVRCSCAAVSYPFASAAV